MLLIAIIFSRGIKSSNLSQYGLFKSAGKWPLLFDTDRWPDTGPYKQPRWNCNNNPDAGPDTDPGGTAGGPGGSADSAVPLDDPRAPLGVRGVHDEQPHRKMRSNLRLFDHGKYGNCHCRQSGFL